MNTMKTSKPHYEFPQGLADAKTVAAAAAKLASLIAKPKKEAA